MTLDPVFLIYGAIFVSALFLMELLLRLLTREDKAVNRRMRLRGAGKGTEQVLSILHRTSAQSLRRNVEDQARTHGVSGLLTRMLLDAGSATPLWRFLLLTALTGGVFATVIGVAVPGLPRPVLVLPFLFVFVVVFIALRFQRHGRLRRFTEQLPDAIDMMVRSLRAGHPINTSMALVAREMPDPIGSEFGIVVDEVTYGLELSEALDQLRLRVDVPDLQYMIVAMNIQMRTGGNLAEVLANLSLIIRDRFRLLKKARALSAEGRLAALIVSVVPFVVVVILTMVKSDFYTSAMGNPVFWMIAVFALVWYIGSILLIRKIVNIEV